MAQPPPVLEPFAFSFHAEGNGILAWNKKGTELLGWKQSDVFEQVWHERVIAPGRGEAALHAVWGALGADPPEAVLPMVARSGEHCSVRFIVRNVGNGHMYLFSVGHAALAAEELAWPVEVREVPGCGKAVFATRDIGAYETVFEEEPFYTRLQPEAMKDRQEWDERWTSAFCKIKASLRFPGDDDKLATPLLASSALVRDALSIAGCPDHVRGALDGLSAPPLGLDHALVEVSRQVAALCRDRLPECKNFSLEELHRGILALEMNTFPGGRVFWTTSRVNHSCAANCIFNSVPGKWGLKTLRAIRKGEELTLSYLGHELLFPTPQRRRLLWRSKCFVCACSRCAAAFDPTRDRACVVCNARAVAAWHVVHDPLVWCRDAPSTQGKSLTCFSKGSRIATTGQMRSTDSGDWVEVDPEHHEKGGWVLVHGGKLGLGQLIAPGPGEDPGAGPGQDLEIAPGILHHRYAAYVKQLSHLREACPQWYDFKEIDALRLPRYCLDCPAQPEGGGFAHLEGDRYRCAACGREDGGARLLPLERALGDAAQRVFSMDLPECERVAVANRKKGLPLVEDRRVLEALMVADDAAVVFGRRHWIWQAGLIYLIDLSLSIPKWAGITWNPSYHTGTVAALIEVWDWIGSLGLSGGPSLWLLSRAEQVIKPLLRSDAAMDDRLRGLCEELQERIARSTPFVDLLGPREFLPMSLFRAN